MTQQRKKLVSAAVLVSALLSFLIIQNSQAGEPKFIHSSIKQATTLDMLQAVSDWSRPANGVWIASIGDMSAELRYTDLAAEAPRIDRINTLGDPDFPFAAEAFPFSLAR